MPGERTEVTEIATALGMLTPSLSDALTMRPTELLNVSDDAWENLIAAWSSGRYTASFETAFRNGRAFLDANDALRGRKPLRVEWKGPHRPPGDDVVPADLRVDHVYLVSCKYFSKVLLNPGPQRLFERLLVGDGRDGGNWFAECAAKEFQEFYEAAIVDQQLVGFPGSVLDLNRSQQQVLKDALSPRRLPRSMQESWMTLCSAVATESANRWNAALGTKRLRLRLLWRLLRISSAAYFVLGTDRNQHLRFRVDSAWDWMQAYDLRSFSVEPRVAGQPEVAWQALVHSKSDDSDIVVDGHVEVRWSHGRFRGVPEAKVYLDTSHADVPGYNSFD